MKVAVVGHVEWGRFARVGQVPTSGEIVRATEYWEEVAGGGSVAAMHLASMDSECHFFTKIGNDELGSRAVAQLEAAGVVVHAAIAADQPTKTILVHIDAAKERTITVVGNLKPSGADNLPWEMLKDMDAVYFVSGDGLALHHARGAKTLVSTARILPLLKETGIQLDALVHSANDASEVYQAGDIDPAPKVVVTTNGAAGGVTDTGIRYTAVSVESADIIDSYGCGDSFAAGLTYGLGGLASIEAVLQTAAESGARALLRRGAFGN